VHTLLNILDVWINIKLHMNIRVNYDYPYGFHPAQNLFARANAKLPFDIWQRVAALVEPVDLDRLASVNAAPDMVVEGWLATLSRFPTEDLLAGVVTLLLFDRAFSSSDHRLDGELRTTFTHNGRYMTLGGTRFEVRRRLSSQLYDLGRRGKISTLNRVFLAEAIELFDFLLIKDKLASTPQYRYKYVGMRGQAHLLLARGSDEPFLHYSAARRDLTESGTLGDDSPQHAHYLAESCVECFDLRQDAQYLDAAEAVLTSARHLHPNSRPLTFYAGEVELRRGFMAAGVVPEVALSFFSSATQLFTRALEMPPHRAVSDDYIIRKRGQARFRTYTTRYSFDGSEDEESLELAINDLSHVGVDGVPVGGNGTPLPSSLSMRAQRRQKRGDYINARDDYRQALSAFQPTSTIPEFIELHCQLQNGLWQCEMIIGADAADANAVRSNCEALLAAQHGNAHPTIALTRAGRYLATALPYEESSQWIVRISDSIVQHLRTGEMPPSARRFAASHAAGLLFLGFGKQPIPHATSHAEEQLFVRNRTERLESIYELYREAIDAHDAPAPAELYGYAGEVALRLAKLYLTTHQYDRAEAASFFDDACEFLELSLIASAGQNGETSALFSLKNAHSKLGEAYVRLHALTLRREIANKAIEHLTISREMGNTSPENMGLLGDAYYRRGRASDSVNDLLQAIEFKREAWQLALAEDQQVDRRSLHNFRENRSVSARAHFQVWDLIGDVGHLARSVGRVLEAVEEDAMWPWPFFQLAEVASQPEDVRHETVRNVTTRSIHAGTLKQIHDGDVAALHQQGCRLAVNNREFERDDLGGRQLVYTLKDPHRLLSQSFVFKHTTRGTAEHEMSVIEDFSHYLQSKNAPPELLLPEPLLILPTADNDNVAYVMRRAQGKQLAQTVVEWIRGQGVHPQDYFARTLQFLAYYHAWGAERQGVRRTDVQIINKIIDEVVKQWRSLGVSNAEESELRRSLAAAVPRGLPAFLKKDAHAENWLVSSRGRIVMLDLEASAKRPLMFEVAQLLDDYPLFEANGTSWRTRLELCREYLGTLNKLGVNTSNVDNLTPDAFAVFVLFRVASGVARKPSRKAQKQHIQSSSSIRAATARKQHYLHLIDFLSTHATTTELRRSASVVRRLANSYTKFREQE